VGVGRIGVVKGGLVVKVEEYMCLRSIHRFLALAKAGMTCFFCSGRIVHLCISQVLVAYTPPHTTKSSEISWPETLL